MLHASCETTYEKIYLKVVNVSSEAQELFVQLDTAIQPEIESERIEGTPDQQNSFENPLNIAPITETFKAVLSENGCGFTVSVPAYSVNVYCITR